MTAYIARRLGQALLVIIGVSLIVFLITKLLPGGPARAILGPRATQGQIHAFLVANGYTKPIFVQYVDYISRLVRGNLGFSYHYNQSVVLLLSQNLPKSALLIGLAYVVALVIAIPIGMIQGVRRNKVSDYALTGIAFIGYSMPLFWLGIILILLFSVTLHWFPPEAPQGATVGAVLQQPSALVLPVVTLAIVTIALFSRFVRSSTIENLTQDYVRTARAKGVPDRRILFGHVLRNSLIPIITLVGLSLPVMISGAVIVEAVFNYPGMGLLFWNAATTQDYPVLMGFTIVVAFAAVLGSLIADLLYAVADPRVRLA
ncbi:MAG TPA: ABC transporter permease [Solirubrobacteraceae bacterium]|nr:ABC transporter permease [Solirubrobacteraceae bacterium]